MKGLSLDGGGTRGAGQAEVLRLLSERPTVPLFDIVCGTSVGAINAAYYSFHRGDCSRVTEFFLKEGPRIFKRPSLARRLNPFSPAFNDAALNDTLISMFPIRFGALPIPTVIVAINMDRQRLKVFKSWNPDDGAWPLWEVVRSSVAAPTYFAPWAGCTDGGPFANHPAMVLASSMLRDLHVDPHRAEIFSIGTGEDPSNKSTGSARSWGKIRWGAWLIKASLNGASNSMHERFVSSLPIKRYERHEFTGNPAWHFTDPASSTEIIEQREYWIQNTANDAEAFLRA